MPSSELGAGWAARVAIVAEELRAWRTTHPRATFDEIETAVDAQLDAVRASILQDLALASPATTNEKADPPRCPQCGQRAWRRGARSRTLVVQGDQPVTFERGSAVCPVCRTGFFPPR